MTLITDWSTNLRYRPYSSWPETYKKELADSVASSTWRLNYHIQPETGLLNDPNGFSYFNKQWHLFYQAYPMGAVHGVKSWYHLTSTNLIDWKKEGLALLPDTSFDSHGVYSGSALVVDEKLFLSYTGNVRGKDWERISYQLGAFMDQNNKLKKEVIPLLSSPPAGYTQEFRDPQIISYGTGYLMVIGSQTEKEEGKILLYKSSDLTDWELLNELHFSDEKMGFMIECPNLIFIDSQPILLFCPQGVAKETLQYENIYPNAYIVGESFDLATCQITNPTPLINLDEGFDVYATQAFNAPDGRALAISWVGLPELTYPTDNEGWAHCLSIVKELKLVNQTLYQEPVAEMKELRLKEQKVRGILGESTKINNVSKKNCYELNLTITKGSVGTLDLFANKENTRALRLHFDTKNGKIKLDRTHLTHRLNQEFGEIRSTSLPSNTDLTLQLFVDQSVCELFVNNGTRVFTSRVFPEADETHLFIEGENGSYAGSMWELRASVH